MKPFSIQHSAFSIFPKAFSLVEIMFAVMILGIGFIMIAAMFPVAIQQSQATVSETTGTFVAESAMRTLKAVPAGWYATTPAWTPVSLGTQQVSASDPQYGFMTFSRQQPPVPPPPITYQLATIAVQARNTSSLTAGSYDFSTVAPYHNCMLLSYNVSSTDFGTVTFDTSTASYLAEASQAVEGAYVLVYRGFFQLGTLTGPNTWSIVPVASGSSMDGVSGINVAAFIIGRGLSDPTLPYNAATNPYTGPAMPLHATIAPVTK